MCCREKVKKKTATSPMLSFAFCCPCNCDSALSTPLASSNRGSPRVRWQSEIEIRAQGSLPLLVGERERERAMDRGKKTKEWETASLRCCLFRSQWHSPEVLARSLAPRRRRRSSNKTKCRPPLARRCGETPRAVATFPRPRVRLPLPLPVPAQEREARPRPGRGGTRQHRQRRRRRLPLPLPRNPCPRSSRARSWDLPSAPWACSHFWGCRR